MLETIQKWLPLVVLVIQLLLSWFMWTLSRQFMPRKECELCREDMKKKVDVLEKGAAVADALRSGTPTAEEIGEIHTSVEAIRGDIKGLRADINGQGELLRRLERPVNLLMEHHLKDGR